METISKWNERTLFLASGLPTHIHNYCKMLEFANKNKLSKSTPLTLSRLVEPTEKNFRIPLLEFWPLARRARGQTSIEFSMKIRLLHYTNSPLSTQNHGSRTHVLGGQHTRLCWPPAREKRGPISCNATYNQRIIQSISPEPRMLWLQ
jgi:hypothetical protein